MHRFVGLVALAVVLTGCAESGPDAEAAGTWLQRDPIQCRMNPWEQEGKISEDEAEQIRSYYASRDVTVVRVEFRHQYDAVCDACTCPRGDRAFVLVESGDAERMRGLGWEASTGPSGSPTTPA